jgi:hypothetical protein
MPELLTMFLDELTPLAQELVKNPVAFAGGFVAGILRLNLNDDPVKSWLEKQSGFTMPNPPASPKTGPQSIDID